jgi:hypothetical protein
MDALAASSGTDASADAAWWKSILPLIQATWEGTEHQFIGGASVLA